jgi:arginyl-tRNA synthetase
MIKDELKKKLINALKKINFEVDEKLIDLQPPNLLSFGDYSTSIALKLAKNLKENPINIGKKIINNLEKNELIEKVEIIKPGFINFWLSKTTLFSNLSQLSQENFTFPSFHFGKNKRILIEYAQPNTHKLFHIGHLRNITLGEALARIFEALGNKVIRANYQGDVGLHIAKCLWAIKKEQEKNKNILDNFKTISQKIEFIGKMYTKGTKAYEKDEKAKNEIIEINKQIYEKDPKIFDLWQKTRQWSLDYFEKIYKRLNTKFDRLFFESETSQQGVKICQEALKREILEKSQGAIVFNGKKYGLDTRVFINSLGYPTYEGKELALAEKEFSEFGEIDKAIHLTTPEQKSFFKVTFKVEELLNPQKFKDKQYHLTYEWVKLKEGRMTSREGNIIEANWLIDEVKKKILTYFKMDDETAEKIAIASVKYAFLKISPENPISFDIKESISLKGNSGPYLLYTYIRAKSVLEKERKINLNNNLYSLLTLNLKIDELDLLRFLNLFSESIAKSAFYFSPHFLCKYLYELSQKFNLFYENNPILKEKNTSLKNFRLLTTAATANIIKKGLYLLGIKTVEKM